MVDKREFCFVLSGGRVSSSTLRPWMALAMLPRRWTLNKSRNRMGMIHVRLENILDPIKHGDLVKPCLELH